jgi:hypothetical protein
VHFKVGYEISEKGKILVWKYRQDGFIFSLGRPSTSLGQVATGLLL